jgi:hypothetical protein
VLDSGDTFTRGGLTFRVDHERDDDHGAPWEECDGHGPVSDWTWRNKRSGEMELARCRHGKRYYDFAEAVRIAKRDRWNAAPYYPPGEETRGQRAAKAALANFEYLKDWCEDRWCYVGVIVTLLDSDGGDTGENESLWGIESNADDYLTEAAEELADTILDRVSTLEAAAIAEARPDLAPGYL